MEAVKKIGIIGGSGPEATILLQQMIINTAREKYGAKRLEHNPHLLIASVPLLQDVTNESELKEVIDSLKKGAESLKKAGADIMCMACNTHHLSLDKVREHVGVPFISMLDLVGQKAVEEGVKRVAVIGTGYTLRNALYENTLSQKGIEIVEIGEELTQKSQDIIEEALSGIKPEMVADYISLVEEIKKKFEFDALILGCTEYSVLEHERRKNNEDFGIKIIDPLKELANKIVETSYSQ